MGLPWVAFPRHLAGFVLACRVYALSALWLSVAFQYFVWQLPLLVVSVGLIGAGIWFHRSGSSSPDAGAMLAAASQHMLDPPPDPDRL